MSIIFRGWWNAGKPYVTIHDVTKVHVKHLTHPQCDAKSKPPFTWGKASAATSVLALSLLNEACGSFGIAAEYAEKFATEVLAPLRAGDNFAMHCDAIKDWIFSVIAEELFPTFSPTKEISNG